MLIFLIENIESVIMIIPRRTLFIENCDRLRFFFIAQFSDHLCRQVHHEKKFGQVWSKI